MAAQDPLYDSMSAFLAGHQVALLSTRGSAGAWTTLVHYRSRGLDIACWLPRWADAAFFAEQDARLLLLIQDFSAPPGCLRWLQYSGIGQTLEANQWPAWLPGEALRSWPPGLFCILLITPRRLDWIDESLGWGIYETLEPASWGGCHPPRR